MSDIERNIYSFSPGLHIRQAAELLLNKAEQQGREVTGVFNDTVFHAGPADMIHMVVEDWEKRRKSQ